MHVCWYVADARIRPTRLRSPHRITFPSSSRSCAVPRSRSSLTLGVRTFVRAVIAGCARDVVHAGAMSTRWVSREPHRREVTRSLACMARLRTIHRTLSCGRWTPRLSAGTADFDLSSAIKYDT
jgi:hypothetical protein